MATMTGPIVDSVFTENFLHFLSTDIGGNSCGLVRAKLEAIYLVNLNGTIDLGDLCALATRLETTLIHLGVDLGWPILQGANPHGLCTTLPCRRRSIYLRAVISVVRQSWLSNFSKSRCGRACPQDGCPDWRVLCAYQDAIRTHIQEWVNGLSSEASAGDQDYFLIDFLLLPGRVMSSIWALEFLAILVKNPRMESFVQSLRVALENYLSGSEEDQWIAVVPDDWHKCCVYWRDHDHGLECSL
jgi:hypothetical protein